MATRTVDWGAFGNVEENVPPTPVEGRPDLKQSELVWKPTDELLSKAQQLGLNAPSLETLHLSTFQFGSSRGVRLVPPEIDYLVPFAKLWGREILEEGGVWNSGEGYELDFGWFLYQKACRTHAFIKRAFKSMKDLRVSEKAQEIFEHEHILSVAHQGKIMTAETLLDLGDRIAEERGEPRTVATKIRLGLYACAKDNSLPMEPENVAGLIRQALFDEEKAPPRVDEEVLEQVKQRSELAFSNHLDESLEETYDWLWGSRNTFLSQIIKQQKQPGGVLDRQAALASLIELGWRGLHQVSECIEAVMRSVAESLPDDYALSDEGHQLHDLLYYRQERLGGLPLILLKQRFSFAEEAICDLMNSPGDDRCFQVLYRLLSLYADMAGQRRQADRLDKQLTTFEFRDSDHSKDNKSQLQSREEFQELADKVREQRKATCKCENNKHWLAKELEIDEASQTATWTDRCKRCGHEETVSLSVSEMRELKPLIQDDQE